MKIGDAVRLKNPDIVGVKTEGTVVRINLAKQLATVRWKLTLDHGILSQSERLEDLIPCSEEKDDRTTG